MGATFQLKKGFYAVWKNGKLIIKEFKRYYQIS